MMILAVFWIRTLNQKRQTHGCNEGDVPAKMLCLPTCRTCLEEKEICKDRHHWTIWSCETWPSCSNHFQFYFKDQYLLQLPNRRPVGGYGGGKMAEGGSTEDLATLLKARPSVERHMWSCLGLLGPSRKTKVVCIIIQYSICSNYICFTYINICLYTNWTSYILSTSNRLVLYEVSHMWIGK